jgi:tripartite-type tricarboxylate transporter receptor subunit TctC
MIAQNFIGLFVPAGTPQAIIERIADATRIAMGDVELQQKLVISGFEPYASSAPEVARRFIEDETARWMPVIKAQGIRYE